MIAISYIVFMWIKKDIVDIYASMPAEQVAPMIATTIAVSLLKVAAMAGGIFLIKWVVGKFAGKGKTMNSNYIFRQAEPGEIQAVFDLIMGRVAWMDQVGIRQWNTTKYDQRYPLSYYEERRQMEEMFVLTDREDQILAVGALFHEDERWPEPASAFYLHHLASRVDAKGSGSIFLQMAEEYTAQMGKTYMRLDSAIGNGTLEQYYTSRGYVAAGYCKDGLYEGVLRQKKLR